MQVVIDGFMTPGCWQAKRRSAQMWLLHICGALVLIAAGVCAAAQHGALSDKALVQALRGGGYTIYFRHAATEWSQSDRVSRAGDWTSCDPARIRQLSAEGRRAAQSVGDAIRALVIPIGRVMSSPYCRCKETAEQMRLGRVETTDGLMNLRVAAYFGGANAIIERARRLLGRVPKSGTNTVLVAHGNLARAATSVYPDEAEGLIFQAQLDGSFVFIGRLNPSRWRQLAEAFSP